ncbi:MAG: HAMP domain-containing sensor histidine kinase [Elusimicrobiota bacterium]
MSVWGTFFVGAACGALGAGALAWAIAHTRIRRLGRQLAFVLHEINTPVTALNMTVLNLLTDTFGPLPEFAKPWVDMAREQHIRLGALLAQTRDFVHMELSGDFQVSMDAVPAKPLLEDALAGVHLGMRQSRIELRLESEGELGRMRTDRDRALRCLMDLLLHARKFRVSGPVVIRSRQRPERVTFIVEYQGSPEAASQAAACLDVYYPARRRATQTLSATGLGLGMTRLLARRIAGELDFKIGRGGEATMTLSFPAEGGAP